MIDSTPLPLWPLLASALALLLPWGVGLLVADDEAPVWPGIAPLLALLLALIGYAATGFALHFGGIGILIDHPDVTALVWEWTPMKTGNLAFWGLAGWMGFGMAEVQTPLAALLFLSALPLAATASLLSLMTFWRRGAPAAGLFMAALMALALAPLVGNWTQAGGWLMYLGESIGAGAGYLDFGGASFYLAAGGVALAALLATRGRYRSGVGLRPSPLAAWGVGLLMVGGVGWIIASPLHVWSGSSPAQAVLNGLLALAAGGLIGLAYSFFALGQPDAGLIARSAAAGWVASLAALLWMTPLQAMLVGAVAAWLLILASWLISELLGWYDPGDAFALFGVSAGWGLLAVGFFAPAPGQFRAQIIGVTSIFLLSFFITSVFQILILTVSRSPVDSGRETDPDALSPGS